MKYIGKYTTIEDANADSNYSPNVTRIGEKLIYTNIGDHVKVFFKESGNDIIGDKMPVLVTALNTHDRQIFSESNASEISDIKQIDDYFTFKRIYFRFSQTSVVNTDTISITIHQDGASPLSDIDVTGNMTYNAGRFIYDISGITEDSYTTGIFNFSITITNVTQNKVLRTITGTFGTEASSGTYLLNMIDQDEHSVFTEETVDDVTDTKSVDYGTVTGDIILTGDVDENQYIGITLIDANEHELLNTEMYYDDNAFHISYNITIISDCVLTITDLGTDTVLRQVTLAVIGQ